MCNRQGKLARMYMRQRDIDRKCRRKEQERIAYVNRESGGIFRAMLKITFLFMAAAIGIAVWMWAAGRQAEMEAQAAVLRRHRITSQNITAQYPHSPNAGLQAEDPYMVEPLPLTPPEDGEPPQAIEIKMATKAEAIPAERWESLGRWKLTAYCPLECCNGKGRAWTTASGAPMVIGETVATARLPYGTKLKVNGKIYTVTDRGTPYGTLDILHESDAACFEFGIQYAEVFVLR